MRCWPLMTGSQPRRHQSFNLFEKKMNWHEYMNMRCEVLGYVEMLASNAYYATEATPVNIISLMRRKCNDFTRSLVTGILRKIT